MTQQQRPLKHFTADEINEYAWVLRRRLVQILTATGRSRSADDVAQRVSLQFCKAPLAIMTDYPSAATYASVCANHAFVSFQRSERVQRCEGANLIRSASGDYISGRTSISGNARIDESDREYFDTLDLAGDEFAERLADDSATRSMLEACLIGLDAKERELLYLVDGMGYQVKEVAQMVGQARETVNRRLSRIRRQVQMAASQFAVAA